MDGLSIDGPKVSVATPRRPSLGLANTLSSLIPATRFWRQCDIHGKSDPTIHGRIQAALYNPVSGIQALTSLMRHKLHPKVAPTANNNQPPLSPVRLFQSVPLWDSPLSKDPLGLRLQISSDADESRPTVDHPLRQSAPDEACLTSSNRTAPFPVEAVTEQGREQKGGSRHGPYLLISTAFLERHSSSALSALSALYTVRCFPRRWTMDKRPSSHATACNSLGVVTCNRAAVSRTHVHHRPALLHLEGVSFGRNTLHMCNRDETGWSGRMRDERRNGKQPRFPGAIFFPFGLACKCTTDTGTVCDTALSLLRFTACVLPCCPILCLRLCPAPHCMEQRTTQVTVP